VAEEEAGAEASPETREQKMAHALKLVMDLVKGPIGIDDRINLPAHAEKLLTDLVANGELAVEDMLKVMCNMTPITSDLHLEAQMSKGQAAIETLLFTYADLATDVLMIVEYLNTPGREGYGRSGRAGRLRASGEPPGPCGRQRLRRPPLLVWQRNV
jgi:hypothetical protein